MDGPTTNTRSRSGTRRGTEDTQRASDTDMQTDNVAAGDMGSCIPQCGELGDQSKRPALHQDPTHQDSASINIQNELMERRMGERLDRRMHDVLDDMKNNLQQNMMGMVQDIRYHMGPPHIHMGNEPAYIPASLHQRRNNPSPPGAMDNIQPRGNHQHEPTSSNAPGVNGLRSSHRQGPPPRIRSHNDEDQPVFNQPEHRLPQRYRIDPHDSDSTTSSIRNEPRHSSATDSVHHRPRFPRSGGNPRLPPFTGKESWKTWYTRFHDVARLHRWDRTRKLQELMPRLHGQAGEFVYEQLSGEARNNYDVLIDELNNRFRIVETTKAFATQFNHRTQKAGESTEEYVAELKRLYNKAYPHRDADTRREDLLRQFFNGLADERTRFHVEYIKDPVNIDEALDQVITFQEVRRKPSWKESGNSSANTNYRKPTRLVKESYDTDYESAHSQVDHDEEGRFSKICRAPAKADRSKTFTKQPTPTVQPTPDVQITSPSETATGPTKDLSGDIQQQTLQLVQQLIEKVNNMEKHQEPRRFAPANNTRPRGPRNDQQNATRQPRSQPPRGPTSSTQDNQWNTYTCYRCGEPGHYARNCHLPWITGQLNMAVQPHASYPPDQNYPGDPIGKKRTGGQRSTQAAQNESTNY